MSQPEDVDAIRRALGDALRTLLADRDHGASWLARLVAISLRNAATTLPDVSDEVCVSLLIALHAAARDFADARPSMAAVANTAARLWAAALSVPEPRTALDRLREEADRILDGERTWALAIRDALRPLLGGPVFTFSRSGTVERALLDLLADLPEAARDIFICESRPGGEGIAAARVLAVAGWRVTLLADAAMGAFVSRAALALVGADSIRSDGAVVNKVGTYPLALAARDAGIPFYAACETLKIAAPGFPLVFEEMDPAEILPEPIPGVSVRNPYFERTPARLVTGIVTERGILPAGEIAREAAIAAEALAALERPWPRARA
jgi:translation initiation factor 2B subunit (eIF-2B alpha/beta/delta family)